MESRGIKKYYIRSKTKTSCGIDKISAKVLKSTPENILYALSYVFNLSLINGKYIENFKVGNSYI